MRRDEFRDLVRGFLLMEAEEPAAADPAKSEDEGDASLDVQVDGLLVSYEKNATATKKEGLSVRSMTRNFLLEADEDEDTGKDASAAEPAKKTSEDINIESFSADVARLIENYDNLLEIKDTLARRARDFLKKNYDDATVNDFLSVLREKFDIEIGISNIEKQARAKAPAAERAGSSPSGG